MNGSNPWHRPALLVLVTAVAAFGAGCQHQRKPQSPPQEPAYVAWYDRIGINMRPQQFEGPKQRPVGLPGRPAGTTLTPAGTRYGAVGLSAKGGRLPGNARGLGGGGAASSKRRAVGLPSGPGGPSVGVATPKGRAATTAGRAATTSGRAATTAGRAATAPGRAATTAGRAATVSGASPNPWRRRIRSEDDE